MVTGVKATLRVDLNMLEGNRILTPTAFAAGVFVPRLQPGDLVEVIEAEGDRYLARVEALEAQGKLVRLLIDLESWIPRVEETIPTERVISGSVELFGKLVGSPA